MGKRKRTATERIEVQQRLRARQAATATDRDRPTRERLAEALEKAGAPDDMVARARAGAYDEYSGTAVFPIVDLVNDAAAAGLKDIVARATNGDFDATQIEADDYWQSTEGKATMEDLARELNITLGDLVKAADADRSPTGSDGKPRLEQVWNPPAGPWQKQLDADEVHAAVNMGGRCGATGFSIGPAFHTDEVACSSWTAKFVFKRVGTETQVWSHPTPAAAADALVRKVMRGAQCRECGGLVRLPGDRGAWFPGKPGQPATFHDGHTLTLEEAKSLQQCRWRRVGRRWYAGCELRRAHEKLSQPSGQGSAS